MDMPRGVKKQPTIDEQLKDVESKLEEYAALLKDLEEQREALLEKKKSVDLKQLSDFLEVNGLSAYDAMALLTPAVAAAANKQDTEI